MEGIEVDVTDWLDKWDIPEPAEDFIKFWQDKFSEVPECYKSTARVILYVEPSYSGDKGEGLMKLVYTRSESTKECANREFRESKTRRHQEERELRELKKLKGRYE